MGWHYFDDARPTLVRAMQDGNLTPISGAGVSVSSRLSVSETLLLTEFIGRDCSRSVATNNRAGVRKIRYEQVGAKGRGIGNRRAFFGAGVNAATQYQREIRIILSTFYEATQQRELNLLRTLRITAIWYGNHPEIP